MKQVSLIAKQADEVEKIRGIEVEERIGTQDLKSTTSAAADALATSTWATILVVLSSLAIPGVGPIIAAGTLGVAMVTTVAGMGVEALASSNIVQTFTHLGIPKEQARVYSDSLHGGHYLVIVEGS